MAFQMTIREALKIQAEQLDYYDPIYPGLRKIALAANKIEGLDLDEARDCGDITNLVPRGCDLGYLIGVDF